MLWKTIPGFSFYQVSENGDVRRDPEKRMRGWGPTRPPGGLLHPNYKDKIDKYLMVNIKRDDGKNKGMKIHQLVCMAYCGDRPSKEHCALHKDDCRYNNHFTNLYWGTKHQNAIDREKNQSSGTACLDETQVRWVKEIYFGDRWTIEELAMLFEVRTWVIRGIVTGRSYQWVTNGLVPHVV